MSLTLDEIKELAGHREVSPWVVKLVQDAVDRTLSKTMYLRKEIPLKGRHSEDYEDGFWEALELYEEAIRKMKQWKI